MSPEKNASRVNVFGVIGEAIRSLAQSNLKALAWAPALVLGGFIAADASAFVFHRSDFMEFIQGLLKIVVVLATPYLTVYLMRLPSAANEPVLLKALLLELKNKLPRILKTFGAMIERFKGPLVLLIISSLLANLTRTPEVFLLVLPVIGIWSLYLLVRYVFVVYLIFDPDLKPGEIPARSETLTKGQRWKIFFTILICGVLISAVFAPLFLLYAITQGEDKISAMNNFKADFFRGPTFFVLFYYIIYAAAVVFQTTIFMKFYDNIAESLAQQKLPEESAVPMV